MYQKKQIVHLLYILVFAYILVTCAITWNYYQSYRHDMDVLAEITAKSGQDGIDVVSEILKKDRLESAGRGKQILDSYGYLKADRNIFYKRFLHESKVTAISVFILFALLFGGMLLWQSYVARNQMKVINRIEDIVVNFRENNFEVCLDADHEYEKIKYELEALGNYFKLLKEEARLEREGTKKLVSDISHQLKTPVAALDTCFSVLLGENLSKEEQKEFKLRSRNALDGLENLLKTLLQISKMEAGIIQIEKERVPLLDTIVRAVNRVYLNASEKDIELIFDYDETLEKYEIMQDKKWLQEAIINVLDNAIKYSHSNSEITVRLQKRMGFARIEIEDQGIGIPKEEYHKIFQRFYRGTLPEVKEANGSGIGLYLTREIIEKHQGTITVSSCWGQKGCSKSPCGSTFVIQIPDNE